MLQTVVQTSYTTQIVLLSLAIIFSYRYFLFFIFLFFFSASTLFKITCDLDVLQTVHGV